MPTVGIDCRFAGEHAGLGTYTRSIVQALMKRDDPWEYRLFVKSEGESWVSEFALSDRISFTVAPFGHYSFREQWNLPILIRQSECDLFFAPHFNVPLLLDEPFICTVHDLILHRFPNQANFLKRLAYKVTLSQALRKAKSIVCVSEHTKKEVSEFSSSAAQKSSVIYPGVAPEFHRREQSAIEEVRKKYSLYRPFLLYVGNCKQHKNVPVLIDAFAQANLEGIELILVSSGKECEALTLRNGVRRIANVDQEDLPSLYSAALAYVSATLAEGFGMPMIEAMACRCPVLATHCGSIPEICSDHALLVEPTVPALASGMQKIAFDSSLRDAKRLEAAEISTNKYNWEKAAAELSGVFREQLSALPSLRP